MKNEHQEKRKNKKDGWEYFYQGTANPQPGCAAPRWSRPDCVSITNATPFISALNQSELEFSGLAYIFFSLQNLALLSTNSMPRSRNGKSNEGRGFLDHAWDALAELWGTSHSTCPGCSWQRSALLGFPFPDPQLKTTFKEAVPMTCSRLASNGWCLGGKREITLPCSSWPLYLSFSPHLVLLPHAPASAMPFLLSFFSLYNLSPSYVTTFQKHNSVDLT